MGKNYYHRKSADAVYLKKFVAVLDDYANLYAMVLDKVRDTMKLEDDRAIQAAAYTLWRQTTDTVANPDLVIWNPSENAVDNLVDFEDYGAWYGNAPKAFLKLAAEYAGIDEDQALEILTMMDVTTKVFAKVVDFVALAELVKLNHLRLIDEVEDEEEAEKEMVRLNNKAMGFAPGKDVGEILGGI